MPRILFVVNRFNIGGISSNVALLAKHLQADFETRVIGGVPDEGESDALYMFEELGIQVDVISHLQRKISWRNDWEAYKYIKQAIQTYKPDIVHTHAAKAGVLGRIAAYRCGVPVILHTFHGHVFHSYFDPIKTLFFKLIERYLAKKSTGIIALSEAQKNELALEHKICPIEKLSVIQNGFDLMKFQLQREENRKTSREKYGIQENEVAIGMIGRLAPIKNNIFLIQVLTSILEKENLSLKLFIVGNGSEWAATKLAASKFNERFGKKIIMTSWITDIAPFYAGMDIVALTSKNEGTPTSIIEAQASEVAVISSDVGGVKDLIQDEISGFLVPSGNSNAYEEKLTLLLKNKEIRHKIARKGQEIALEKFNYTTMIQNISAYYFKLLNKNT